MKKYKKKSSGGCEIYSYYARQMQKYYPDTKLVEWDDLDEHDRDLWGDMYEYTLTFKPEWGVSTWGMLYEHFRGLRFTYHRHRYPICVWNKLGVEHRKVWKKLARKFL